MPNLGFGELVVVLLIVIVIFGANRLPQIGEGVGKAIRNLKRGLAAEDDIDVTPKSKRVASESSAEPMPKSEMSEAEIVEKKG